MVLFYFGRPVSSIVALGFVASKEPKLLKGHFDWTKRKRATFCDFSPIWLLRKKAPLEEICNNSALKAWYQKKPYRNSRELALRIGRSLLSEITRNNPDIQRRLSKLGIKVSEHPKPRLKTKHPVLKQFAEGGVKEITSELQQRNPKLRAQAIAVYGETCRACGFNFEKHYGDIAAGYIEVHHLKPLSERKSKRNVTIEDVDVVCANCHRVLHRNGRKPISLDALRKVIKQRRKQRRPSGEP